ncbi:hypothetical protein Q1695_005497 [Nippostrongylus brasiliensis]|nr:hypothetical protein Q1695_005497 [Nippostrongylus brasiliensis]
MERNCSEYEPFATYWPFHVAILMQVIFGFVSASLAIPTLVQCKKLYFHVNCKLMHLWKYSFSKSPCDIVTSALTCTILRFPLTTSFTSFVILQFMMILERIVATVKRSSYEKTGRSLGIGFTLFALASSVLLVTWTILPEKFTNVYPYCSSGSNQTINRLSLINMFLCGLCMTSLVGIVAFKFYNRYAVDRRTYNLRDSFHLRENRHIVQLLFPLVLFQAGFLLVFTTIGAILPSFRGSMAPIIFRTAFCATYLIPYYTVVTPLIILAMIRKAQKNNVRRLDMMRNVSNEKELYFTNYMKIWNRS